MPRNRSGKLPPSPEAHAYADACEYWLLTEDRSRLSSLWSLMPPPIGHEIVGACGYRSSSWPARLEAKWRRDVIEFIRKSYAA